MLAEWHDCESRKDFFLSELRWLSNILVDWDFMIFSSSQDQHSPDLTGRRMCSHPYRSKEGQKMFYWLSLMKCGDEWLFFSLVVLQEELFLTD